MCKTVLLYIAQSVLQFHFNFNVDKNESKHMNFIYSNVTNVDTNNLLCNLYVIIYTGK